MDIRSRKIICLQRNIGFLFRAVLASDKQEATLAMYHRDLKYFDFIEIRMFTGVPFVTMKHQQQPQCPTTGAY